MHKTFPFRVQLTIILHHNYVLRLMRSPYSHMCSLLQRRPNSKMNRPRVSQYCHVGFIVSQLTAYKYELRY
jgi:hypothetical protein